MIKSSAEEGLEKLVVPDSEIFGGDSGPAQEKLTRGGITGESMGEGKNSVVNMVRYIGGLGKRLFFSRPPEIMGLISAFGHSAIDFSGYLIKFNEDLLADAPKNASEREEQYLDLGIYGFKLLAAGAGATAAYYLPFEAPDNPLFYIPAIVNTASLVGRGVKHRKRIHEFLTKTD
jgi:hypothetical protein